MSAWPVLVLGVSLAAFTVAVVNGLFQRHDSRWPWWEKGLAFAFLWAILVPVVVMAEESTTGAAGAGLILCSWYYWANRPKAKS